MKTKIDVGRLLNITSRNGFFKLTDDMIGRSFILVPPRLGMRTGDILELVNEGSIVVWYGKHGKYRKEYKEVNWGYGCVDVTGSKILNCFYCHVGTDFIDPAESLKILLELTANETQN